MESVSQHELPSPGVADQFEGGEQSGAVLSPKARDELEAEGGHSQAHPFNSTAFAVFQLVMVALTVIFLFGVPFWSWFFNDYLGLIYTSCETPARFIVCGDGSNYTETAVRLGRIQDGEYLGCSCQDGILADWACAVDQGGFSISYFISSAPGTGMLAALTAWPIISSWLYGPLRSVGAGAQDNYSISPTLRKVCSYSQVAFQFFYGLFLINTLCVVPTLHSVVVVTFIIALIVHFATIGYAFGGVDSNRGRCIYGLVIIGTVSVLIGFFWPTGSSWWGQHAFWLGEAIGMSSAFVIAPILTYLDAVAK